MISEKLTAGALSENGKVQSCEVKEGIGATFIRMTKQVAMRSHSFRTLRNLQHHQL
jgi:hypothetical protein